MIIAICILSIIVISLSLFLVSCIIHIRKIQKELEAIYVTEHTQNQDIIKLVRHAHQVTGAVNDITDFLVDKTTPSSKIDYYGPIGKA